MPLAAHGEIITGTITAGGTPMPGSANLAAFIDGAVPAYRPRVSGAGLFSIKIENGRFKIITTRPLDQEVNIDAQDPQHPPTNPVF